MNWLINILLCIVSFEMLVITLFYIIRLVYLKETKKDYENMKNQYEDMRKQEQKMRDNYDEMIHQKRAVNAASEQSLQ